MRLAILGSGGHGRDIAAIAEACGHIVEFYDDDPDIGYEPCHTSTGPFLAGVNDSKARYRLVDSMHRPADAFVVHPSASVALDAVIGDGVVIGQNTTIGPEARLGEHAHINANCFLTRCRVGAFTTIGPGATICGDVFIGDRVSIGAGAVISNLVTIPSDTVIGAGAVIPPGRVLAPGTYVGNPAKPTGGTVHVVDGPLRARIIAR